MTTSTDVINVLVNGRPRSVPAQLRLAALVSDVTPAASGVAAAVNETVVPRSRWAATALSDGDRVEILTAVQGG